MHAYLLIIATTCIAALILTPCAIRVAHTLGWVDQPGLRKVHQRPVAYLGGGAVFGALLIGFAALWFSVRDPQQPWSLFDPRMLAILAGAGIMLLTGLVDDTRGLSPPVKLACQLVAATAVVAMGVSIGGLQLTQSFRIEFGIFGVLLTIFWIVGVTNAVNIIDGLDGLATGLGAVASAAIGWTALHCGNYPAALLMAALLGALLGFMPFNFHPAKVFLGDAGSLSVGFILASTSVYVAMDAQTLVGLGIPVVALGIPVLDTLFSIIRRALERRSILSADRNHLHHRLIDRGHSQIRTMLALVGALCAGFDFGDHSNSPGPNSGLGRLGCTLLGLRDTLPHEWGDPIPRLATRGWATLR